MIICGLKGTGDWAAGERPEDYHEGLLYLFPHGKTPLLSLTAKAKKEKATDWHIHWFEQDLAGTREIPAATVDEYNSTNTTVEFASVQNVNVGTVLKQAYCTANTGAVSILITGKVSPKKFNYSVISGTAGNLNTSKPLTIVGTAHNEGASLPEACSVQTGAKETYCEIFRTPVKISGTAEVTKLRTGDAKAIEKKNALHMIGMDIESSFFHGNGQPTEPRMMKGIYEQLYDAYTANNDVGITFGALDSLAKIWTVFEKVFSYGSGEKIDFCGAGAMNQIVSVIEGKVQALTPVTVYGIPLTRWDTPWGTVYFKTHPLFSVNSEWTNDMAIIDMAHVTYEYLRDISYKDYKDAAGYDAVFGEYIAEVALRLDNVKAHHYVVNCKA
jgi:hypothetical protein